jgi:hypothetical protein
MSCAEDETDIVDRIAQDLPVEVRAAYYRELNYCRSLPESDELLRILRAMQFLTFLMREVPARVVSEREKLERLLGAATDRLKECADLANEYRSEIEARLVALPAAVAEGLRPELIAREINESLRQQFVQSTIPQTAEAMKVIAAQLRGAVADFAKTAATLNHAHRGAAEAARQAVEKLDRTVSDAACRGRQAAEELSSVFRRELRWSIFTLVSLTLAVAFGAGMLYQQWIESPLRATAVRPDAVVEKAPAMVKQKRAR